MSDASSLQLGTSFNIDFKVAFSNGCWHDTAFHIDCLVSMPTKALVVIDNSASYLPCSLENSR